MYCVWIASSVVQITTGLWGCFLKRSGGSKLYYQNIKFMDPKILARFVQEWSNHCVKRTFEPNVDLWWTAWARWPIWACFLCLCLIPVETSTNNSSSPKSVTTNEWQGILWRGLAKIYVWLRFFCCAGELREKVETPRIRGCFWYMNADYAKDQIIEFDESIEDLGGSSMGKPHPRSFVVVMNEHILLVIE